MPRFALLLAVVLCLGMTGRTNPEPPVAEPVNTFSIVAHDPVKQEWGVAVASKYLAVGAVVPWAKAGVGAVATQSYVNVFYGSKGLELLCQGYKWDIRI